MFVLRYIFVMSLILRFATGPGYWLGPNSTGSGYWLGFISLDVDPGQAPLPNGRLCRPEKINSGQVYAVELCLCCRTFGQVVKENMT